MGPRQVGKTTLSTGIIARRYSQHEYLNWDNRQDRKTITEAQWSGSAELIILDEIHKYKKWKTLVKGIYDTQKDRYKILVTGSARLNIFRKRGDSLHGRYHYYTLHPFSLAEIENISNNFQLLKELEFKSQNYQSTLDTLFNFGGFP